MVKAIAILCTLLFFVVVPGLLLALPTMYLCNYLLADEFLLFVFGIPALTFWKAFFLNILAGSIMLSRNDSNKES